MSDRTDLIYLYDGSFDGLLSCIFESYLLHERPGMVVPEYEFEQEVLWHVRMIETDGDHAERVMKKLSDTLGTDGLRLIRIAFLYGNGGKELAIFRFCRFALKVGRDAVKMLGKEPVAVLYDMEKAVLNEAHLLKGFVRFSDYHGILATVIEPKHYALPLLKKHFTQRYPEEHFLIFDRTHKMALIYRPHEAQIIPLEEFEPPNASLPERQFRRLWQEYYDAIEIKPRHNPRCRMTHMPKRFWGCMTEFQHKEAVEDAPLTIPSDCNTAHLADSEAPLRQISERRSV